MNDLPLLAQSWLLTLRGEGLVDGTIRSYRSTLIDLARYLGGTDYTDAAKDDLRRWVVDMRDRPRPLAQNTIRSRVTVARAFYKWLLAEEEFTGVNPGTGIKPPKEIIPDVDSLSKTEIRSLLNACGGNRFEDRRDTAILLVMIDAGLRRAECAGLLISDINLNHGTVHIVGKGSPGRGPKHRTASIGVRTCQAVSSYLRARAKIMGGGKTDRLWISARHHGPLTTAGIRHVVETRGKVAALPKLHAHTLRHTWASQARRVGLQEGDLMILGGWSNRRQLDRYGRADAANRARDTYRALSVADTLPSK